MVIGKWFRSSKADTHHAIVLGEAFGIGADFASCKSWIHFNLLLGPIEYSIQCNPDSGKGLDRNQEVSMFGVSCGFGVEERGFWLHLGRFKWWWQVA